MPKFITFIALLIGSFYLAPSQAAGFFDGSQLLTYLEKEIANTSDYESGVAAGYLIGIYDTQNGSQFCSSDKKPERVTVRQLQQTVYDYMKEHSKQWELGATLSVMNALKNTEILCSSHKQAVGFLDGKQFVQYLEKEIASTSDYESGVASGYIIGLYDTHNGTLFCKPGKSGGVSVRQLQLIVYDYMTAHSDQWDTVASHVVINALKKTYPFPCD